MKKLSYLFVSIIFLGFLAFPSCGDSAKKQTKEEPIEEVVEEEVVEEMVDTTAVGDTVAVEEVEAVEEETEEAVEE